MGVAGIHGEKLASEANTPAHSEGEATVCLEIAARFLFRIANSGTSEYSRTFIGMTFLS
jgi:hypothetical protein